MRKYELLEQMREVLNRDDLTDAQAEIFLSQGLSRIGRTLRIPSLERVVDLPIYLDEGERPYVEIPRDYVALKDLFIEDLKLRRLEWGQFLSRSKIGHKPQYFARRLRRWYLKPYPNPEDPPTITAVYYGEILPLLEADDSDPLLQVATDLVIYAALGYAATYFLDERKALFDAEYDRIHAELTSQAVDMEWSEGAIQVAGDMNLEY